MTGMESACNSVTPTGLADLPFDILRQIFHSFETCAVEKDGRVDFSLGDSIHDSENRETVASARLTCRALNSIATPLLCPILRVALEKNSLDHANKLCANPSIASGIRGVQIVLSYRPKELAQDISRYKLCRLKDLERLYNNSDLQQYSPKRVTSKVASTVEECAIGNYATLKNAWDALDDEKQTLIHQDVPFYQNLLRECHREYQRKYEETERLLLEQTFVSAVASLMSQLERSASCHLVSRHDSAIARSPKGDTQIFLDSEELKSFLVTPHTWNRIEHLPGGAGEIMAARVLTELPIACHNIGAPIKHLYVDCFPVSSNYSSICPGNDQKLWDGLHAASQAVETFHFGRTMNAGVRPFRVYRTTADEVYINKYITSLLSGHALKQVSIDMFVFGMNCGHWLKENLIPINHRLGDALSKTDWGHIKYLKLSYVSMTQIQFEAFCESLSPDATRIEFKSVHLSQGETWATALGTLRDRFTASMEAGNCDLILGNLLEVDAAGKFKLVAVIPPSS